MAGLAWYYMLAAALNAAAAARLSYGELVSEGASIGYPQDQTFTGRLLVSFLGLYSVAVLMIPGRACCPAALSGVRPVRAPSSLLALWRARMPYSPRSRPTDMAGRFAQCAQLDDHHPAVGLGKPINRTLWTLIWALRPCLSRHGCCLLSEATSQTGMRPESVTGILMPQFMRDASVSSPGRRRFRGRTIGLLP